MKEYHLTDEQRKIVERNMKLVYYFINRHNVPDGEVEDMEQVCMIGLMKAAVDYKPEIGCAFSTFAHKCITHEYGMAIRAKTSKSRRPGAPILSLDHTVANAKRDSSSQITLADTIADQAPEPYEKLDTFERDAILHAALDSDPVLYDHFVRGITYAEIGSNNGYSRAAAHKRGKTAIAKLKAQLSREN